MSGFLYSHDLLFGAIFVSVKSIGSFEEIQNLRFEAEKLRKLDCGGGLFGFTGDLTAQSRQCGGR
jgi:hypothetical protein